MHMLGRSVGPQWAFVWLCASIYMCTARGAFDETGVFAAAVRQPSGTESGACDFYIYFNKPSAFVRNGTAVYFGGSYSGTFDASSNTVSFDPKNDDVTASLAPQGEHQVMLSFKGKEDPYYDCEWVADVAAGSVLGAKGQGAVTQAAVVGFPSKGTRYRKGKLDDTVCNPISGQRDVQTTVPLLLLGDGTAMMGELGPFTLDAGSRSYRFVDSNGIPQELNLLDGGANVTVVQSMETIGYKCVLNGTAIGAQPRSKLRRS